MYIGINGAKRLDENDSSLGLLDAYEEAKGMYMNHVDMRSIKRYAIVVCMGTPNDPFDYQTEGVLLHEVQHLIQEEEDFAHGGDPSMGRMRYRRIAGEVEARNVCYRHLLSQEQRRQKLRTDTQDVTDKMQIVQFA